MERINVLADYLGVDVEEIKEAAWDENTFETEHGEYKVLTDEEADEAAYDYISDSLWAFNANFIIEHSEVLDYDDPSELIVKAIQEQYESGNEAIKKLIDDLDEFVEDAISADGRGHFINSYDGTEDEHKGFFIYRTN